MYRLFSAGQIEPYPDEPLAEDDSSGDGNEVDKEADEDGLTPTVLEARYEREIPVNSWFVKLLLYVSV